MQIFGGAIQERKSSTLMGREPLKERLMLQLLSCSITGDAAWKGIIFRNLVPKVQVENENRIRRAIEESDKS
jgi:hypothetical protein